MSCLNRTALGLSCFLVFFALSGSAAVAQEEKSTIPFPPKGTFSLPGGWEMVIPPYNPTRYSKNRKGPKTILIGPGLEYEWQSDLELELDLWKVEALAQVICAKSDAPAAYNPAKDQDVINEMCQFSFDGDTDNDGTDEYVDPSASVTASLRFEVLARVESRIWDQAKKAMVDNFPLTGFADARMAVGMEIKIQAGGESDIASDKKAVAAASSTDVSPIGVIIFGIQITPKLASGWNREEKKKGAAKAAVFDNEADYAHAIWRNEVDMYAEAEGVGWSWVYCKARAESHGDSITTFVLKSTKLEEGETVK